MGTTIKPELSTDNKYYISKERYYELKHFCLQYNDWLNSYKTFNEPFLKSPSYSDMPKGTDISNNTEKYAILAAYYADKIYMVRKAACDADPEIGSYILKAVTEGLSYNQLDMQHNIPCGRDLYYDRYRKFFYILHHLRE